MDEPAKNEPAPAPANARDEQRMPLGASVGTLVGVCGPAIGLLVVSVAAGGIATLWDEAIGLLLVCLALGLMLLLVAGFGRAHAERTGDRSVQFGLLWGSLLSVMGVLLLLISAWIAPAVEAEPAMQKLGGGFSVHRVPDWVSLTVVAGGIAVLARPARTLLIEQTRAADENGLNTDG